MVRIVSDFLQKCTERLSNLFLRIQKTFWTNRFFRNFSSCSVHTMTLSKKFSDFWGKISVKFSKLIPTPSDKLWWKTILLKILLHSFGLWLMHFFDWWQVYRWKFIKSAVYDIKKTLWLKKVFWKTLPHFFPDREQFIFWLSAKFYREVVQTVLYVFRKHFKDADFLICFVFGANSDFEQIFFWHSAQIFL